VKGSTKKPRNFTENLICRPGKSERGTATVKPVGQRGRGGSEWGGKCGDWTAKSGGGGPRGKKKRSKGDETVRKVFLDELINQMGKGPGLVKKGNGGWVLRCTGGQGRTGRGWVQKEKER